jgi:hypothetical protein
MKVRILFPGRRVDDVTYRCEECGAEVMLSVPRASYSCAEATFHSALMFAALMIGHHFSTSALWKAPSASGVW